MLLRMFWGDFDRCKILCHGHDRVRLLGAPQNETGHLSGLYDGAPVDSEPRAIALRSSLSEQEVLLTSDDRKHIMNGSLIYIYIYIYGENEFGYVVC